jgi:NADH-quinone oxidoreductase subunit C
MDLTTTIQFLQERLGDNVAIAPATATHPPAMEVPAAYIAIVCQLLHTDENFYFDYLACITALDNGPEVGSLELIYNLYSIPYNRQLMIQVKLPRNLPNQPLPSIPTISHIWQTANWHEREAYDLVGVHFTGHPDLRRILLPNDWEGYPLRKDYMNPTHYHDMPTD